MSQDLAALDRDLDDAYHNPGPIRSRLPGLISSEQSRATVCSIRNPDATPDQVAATAGVDVSHLYGGLATVAEDRHPTVENGGPVRTVVYDVFVNRDYSPDDDLAADDLDSLASTVSRLAERPVNPEYIENLLTRDDVQRQCDAARIDGVVTDRMDTSHGLADLVEDIGLRRVVAALGENPPDENLDRLMTPQAQAKGDDAEIGITTDYVRAEASWSPDDIQPKVPYWAKINNKEGYGFFVTLAGHGYDDISGLVHRNNIPGMLSLDDFHIGDEVMVRLDNRKANGDLSFKLVGVIDALNIPTQEFSDRSPVQTVADVTGMDESDLVVGDSQDPDDEPEVEAGDIEDTDPEPAAIKPGTSSHTTLQAIAEVAPTEADALTASELHDRFTDEVKYGTVSSATTRLHQEGYVDRVDAPDGASAKYAYYLATDGEAELDRLGEPDGWSGTEPTESHVCECGETFDSQSALAGHGRWCDADADPEAETDEPEPTTETAPEPTAADGGRADADADFAADVQMMAGMAIGRGDVEADEAAASLRKVADRLEQGAPSTWG